MNNNTNCKDFYAKATPAQRQWVGLTDDEIDSIGLKSAPPVHPDFLHDDDWHEFSRAIEAKLREKNT